MSARFLPVHHPDDAWAPVKVSSSKRGFPCSRCGALGLCGAPRDSLDALVLERPGKAAVGTCERKKDKSRHEEEGSLSAIHHRTMR
ncbi:hypothetical protein D4764_05G0003170 [Takifugu flavidus]|uniref:Uncharacterized protein n=1 Tax=Takifugu flavidus TaxID=433684 RepID=A0A5C6N3C8_9TELE|nr:hypothetical protein D4764_05G0003170 [Takifugu flavidus]